MNKPRLIAVLFVAPAALCALAAVGCDQSSPSWLIPQTKGPGKGEMRKVPPPLEMLLPREMRIHPFTGTRTFGEGGGIRGIEVRIEMLDAYGDATKAFGDFRFELHGTGGKDVPTWDVPLTRPGDNIRHWDNITRTYKFKLRWDRPVPVGRRFVLRAVFSSPYTERLTTERKFISGQ